MCFLLLLNTKRPFKYKKHVCTSTEPLIGLAPFEAFTGFVCGWVFISSLYKTVRALSVVCYNE